MKRTSEFKSKGTMYIISTPIGNLGDFSERAITTLKSLDKLYAEDTRVTSKLLSHYDISLPLDSFHDFTDDSKIEKIVNELNDGMTLGLVSDCGTPIISDPGYELVRRLIEEEIKVIPIPGASAQVTALTMSTLPPKPYLFYGFLSQNKTKRMEELEELSQYPFTMVFYESPHRIHETLKEMYKVFGDRKVSLSRELTKLYEETLYFNLSECNSIDPELKGEMVLVVEGKKEEKIEKTMDEILILLEELIKKENISVKDASKKLSKMYNFKASEIYNLYVRKNKWKY